MLTRLLREHAARSPHKTAIVQGECRVSYAELEGAAGRWAGRLRDAGVEPGDTVGVLLPNGPEFVISLFAIARLHAVMLPLNPAYTLDELRRFLGDRPSRVVITDRDRAAACRAAAAEACVLLIEDGAKHPGYAGANDEFSGPALYLYTSGSTDSYKRICCTQENLCFEARNFVESTGIGAADTILCTIPLFHSYGLGNGLLDAAYTGATLVLEPDSRLPFAARHENVLGLLREEGVRVYPGVPFQFDILARSDADIGAAFRDVTWCVSSGDMLPRRTFDRFRDRTGHPIRSLYGSTEAGSIAIDVGEASAVRYGSLGRALRNVTIEVRQPAGHIWVKSPVIPPGGYDNRPEINAAVFSDGFYDTGDIGALDEGGCLSLTGRKQSFFDVGGHKVDLGEVEEVLLAHPGVREAAAIGIEIPNLGGVIKAAIAAHDGCREKDILDHCRKRLAAYKVPRFVEFRETLPRSPLGKLLRNELADPASWLSDVASARDIPDVPRAQQVEWLARRIQEQVATILRCDAAAIARDVPFQDLGFDSLRAVELQDRLSRMSGVGLSITTLWNYGSVDTYAAFLMEAMRGHAPRKEGVADTGSLDDLSDDEVAVLLAQELDTLEQPGRKP